MLGGGGVNPRTHTPREIETKMATRSAKRSESQGSYGKVEEGEHTTMTRV